MTRAWTAAASMSPSCHRPRSWAGPGAGGNHSEVEAGADRVGDEGVREPGGHGVLGAPAGAVRRDQDARVHRGQVVEDARDQGLEQRAVEVEPAEQRIERLPAGQPPGVAGDVDHASVTAAGKHDQALALDVDDEGLVVEYERVRLPAAAEPRLLRREAGLVAGGPRYLPGDQHGSLEEEARLLLLDDVEARSGQRLAAGGGYLQRLPARQGDAPPPPEMRGDQHRHARSEEHTSEL